MAEAKHTPGFVSRMPIHNGDGYSWGGDIIVTLGSVSLNLGTSAHHLRDRELLALAHVVAAAPELLQHLQNAVSALESWKVSPIGGLPAMRAAIAKALGQES